MVCSSVLNYNMVREMPHPCSPDLDTPTPKPLAMESLTRKFSPLWGIRKGNLKVGTRFYIWAHIWSRDTRLEVSWVAIAKEGKVLGGGHSPETRH